jgi:hypothetical protein
MFQRLPNLGLRTFVQLPRGRERFDFRKQHRCAAFRVRLYQGKEHFKLKPLFVDDSRDRE